MGTSAQTALCVLPRPWRQVDTDETSVWDRSSGGSGGRRPAADRSSRREREARWPVCGERVPRRDRTLDVAFRTKGVSLEETSTARDACSSAAPEGAASLTETAPRPPRRPIDRRR